MSEIRELRVAGADLEALATAILRRGEIVRFRAVGGSMMPFVRDGDLLEVAPAGAIRRGDVVLRRLGPGRLIAHRVRRIRGDGDTQWVLTQGDALSKPDGEAALSDVLGEVIAVERQGRRLTLNAGWRRLTGLFWLSLSPFPRWSFLLAGMCWQQIRSVFTPNIS